MKAESIHAGLCNRCASSSLVNPSGFLPFIVVSIHSANKAFWSSRQAIVMNFVVASSLFALGVGSHLGYFRIGEHHLYGPHYALAFGAVVAVSTALQGYFLQTSVLLSLYRSIVLAATYLSGLYASLLMYRVLFHPLRHFPGPVGFKVSSAWFATYLSNLDAFRQLRDLHASHGTFLRIGSNDISIAHPKAVEAIYGRSTKCRKADWYDLTYPMFSLQSTRDNTIHAQRRRVWSAAFGPSSLRDYAQRISRYRQLMIQAIEKSESKPLNIAKLFNLFTYDVMGDLAFGTSFKMLETNKEHHAIRLLNSGLVALGYKLPIWFFRVVVNIPWLASDWWVFIKYCIEQLECRMQTEVAIPDVMSALLKSTEDHSPTKLERTLLEGDSQLIVVAGSDTTSTTLSTIFRYIAEYPHNVQLLRAELVGLQRTELGDYSHTDLTDLKHLNGVINEALRLFPPVATALPRLTPPEGLIIDGTQIPGNVTVWCSQFVLGRSPECYVSPDEFIPERWYSRPELIRDISGYAPFSAGNYGCIGRPLALLNLQATVSRIVSDFEVEPASGEQLAKYDAGMSEHFTLVPPPLMLSFTKRRRSDLK